MDDTCVDSRGIPDARFAELDSPDTERRDRRQRATL
jgi:hypothetical protein